RLRRCRRIQAGADRCRYRDRLRNPERPAWRQRDGGRGDQRPGHLEAAMSRWLSVVGIGEDGPERLTPAARTLIDTAELLVGGERHLAMLPPRAGQQRRRWTKPLDDLVAEIVAHKGRRVTVLATGDPMWFGIGVTLANHVPAAEMLIIPQAGAFSLAAARLGWALDATDCITLHGRPLDLLALHLQPHARLLILSGNG